MAITLYVRVLFLLLIDGVKRADYNGTRKTYRREGVFLPLLTATLYANLFAKFKHSKSAP